jgi:hypothetical protein
MFQCFFLKIKDVNLIRQTIGDARISVSHIKMAFGQRPFNPKKNKNNPSDAGIIANVTDATSNY